MKDLFWKTFLEILLNAEKNLYENIVNGLKSTYR